MRTSSGHWRFVSISKPRKRHALLFTCRKGLIARSCGPVPLAAAQPHGAPRVGGRSRPDDHKAVLWPRTSPRPRGRDFISNSRLRNFSFLLRVQVPAGAARAGPSHFPRAPTHKEEKQGPQEQENQVPEKDQLVEVESEPEEDMLRLFLGDPQTEQDLLPAVAAPVQAALQDQQRPSSRNSRKKKEKPDESTEVASVRFVLLQRCALLR